jgi:hypothetical protein
MRKVFLIFLLSNIIFQEVEAQTSITGSGSNGQVTFWNGTATQTGDNGFYWDNTNKRVGIGTIAPSVRFHLVGGEMILSDAAVSGSIGAAGNLSLSGVGASLNVFRRGVTNLASATAGDRWAFYADAVGFHFWTGTTGDANVIFPNGNWSIGNPSNAGFKLDVNGTGNFRGALTGVTSNFSGNQTAASFIKVGGTSSQYLMADGSTSTLTNPTLLGLNINPGTSSTPSPSLAITRSVPDNYINLYGVSPSLRLLNNSTGTILNTAIGGAVNYNDYIQGSIPGDMIFSNFKGSILFGSNTLNNNALTHLKVASNGNILIGTLNDNGAKLQVNGTMSVSSLPTGSSSDYMVSVDGLGNFHKFNQQTTQSSVFSTNSFVYNSAPAYVLQDTYPAFTNLQAIIGGSTGINYYIQGSVAGDMVLNNAKGAILMGANTLANGYVTNFKIANSGNVLIGAGSENGSKLQVNGTMSISSLPSGSSTDSLVSVDGLGNLHRVNQQSGSSNNILGTTNYIAKFSSNTAVANSIIYDNGTNVGIGTATPGAYKLAVEGMLGARKIKVTQANPWADYVFDEAYKLPTLLELEKFVKSNKHLPEVPTAKQIEKDGIDIGDNQVLLLKKIEELTLYMIELKKENSQIKKQLAGLKKIKN